MKSYIVIFCLFANTFALFAQSTPLRGIIYLRKNGMEQKQPMPAGASVFILGVASEETDSNGGVSLNLDNCLACTLGKSLMVRVNSKYGWAEKNIVIPANPQENFEIEVMENNTLLLNGTVRDKKTGRFLPGISVSVLIQHTSGVPSVETNSNGVFQIAIAKEGINTLQAISLSFRDPSKAHKDCEKTCYINQYDPIKIELEPEGATVDLAASARALAIEEVVGNLQQLDSRLAITGYALKISAKDVFSIKFDSIVGLVSPIFLPDHRSNYHKMMLRSDLANLRQALNAYPMFSFGRALTQAFIDAETQEGAVWVKKYMDQLAELQYGEQIFFDVWESLANSDDNCKARVERLTINWMGIRNKADLYNLYALRLLKSLNATPENIEMLKFTKTLRFKQPLTDAEFEKALLKNTQEMTENVIRKAKVGKKMVGCRNGGLDSLKRILNWLEVKPNDPLDTIVKKAVILRKLGEKEKAVKAFVLYGEKTAATDSMAADYVKTAIKFTEFFDSPDIDGGAYVAMIMPASHISQSGIQKCDIVVGINEYPVIGPDALIEVLAKTPADISFPVDVLRFAPMSKTFQKMRFILKGKPLGGYFLTI